MSLIVPEVPKNVDLHVHFSNMATADDLMPSFENVLEGTDVLILELINWDPKLQSTMWDISRRLVTLTDKKVQRLSFGQSSPYIFAIMNGLYNSAGAPLVAFNDLPASSREASRLMAVHKQLISLEELVVLRRQEVPFAEAVASSRELCTRLQCYQLGRMNNMLGQFGAIVSRARKRVPSLAKGTLKALMLLGTDHIDVYPQFAQAANNEPTFTVTHTEEGSQESCMLAQFREYMFHGEVSDLLAASLIARTLLLNTRWDKKSPLPAVRDAVDLEVASMSMADIRRLYWQ